MRSACRVGCVVVCMVLLVGLCAASALAQQGLDNEAFWKKASCPKSDDLSSQMAQLRHLEARRRLLGLMCLRRASDPMVFLPLVYQFLGSSRKHIRYAAADTLIWVARESALPGFLMALQRRKRWQAIHSALYGVGRLKQPWSVSRSFYKKVLSHKRWQVQSSALFALSSYRTKDPILAEMITPLFRSRHPLVRRNAIIAFAQLSKDTAAIHASLLMGLKDKVSVVRRIASDVLIKQGASAVPLLPRLRKLRLSPSATIFLQRTIKAIERAAKKPQ